MRECCQTQASTVYRGAKSCVAHRTGSLNKREGLMAAALLRSVDGDLATAANLFETVMLDHPDDMISMKYMQQAYYLLG